MQPETFTAVANTADYAAIVMPRWGWITPWNTTVSITHTTHEWFEFRNHSSDIYNKDYDMLKNHCTSNGQPIWYAMNLRQMIELQVVLYYFPLMELTSDLAKLLDKDKRHEYYAMSYISHKDNAKYQKHYYKELELKNKELEKKNTENYGRVCWFKRRCNELEKEVKQLRKQIENIGAKEIGRMRNKTITPTGYVSTEPNYEGYI